jgi:hypothetical protein
MRRVGSELFRLKLWVKLELVNMSSPGSYGGGALFPASSAYSNAGGEFGPTASSEANADLPRGNRAVMDPLAFGNASAQREGSQAEEDRSDAVNRAKRRQATGKQNLDEIPRVKDTTGEALTTQFMSFLEKWVKRWACSQANKSSATRNLSSSLLHQLTASSQSIRSTTM